MILMNISFDIQTARVRCRGVAPPTPITCPPPRKPYFPEYYVNTCALVGVTQLYITEFGSVDASRHSAVMGWDLCVMVSCEKSFLGAKIFSSQKRSKYPEFTGCF